MLTFSGTTVIDVILPFLPQLEMLNIAARITRTATIQDVRIFLLILPLSILPDNKT